MRNRTKARISDAIYRMRQKGFIVPADIRTRINIRDGATYEEIYAAVAPHATFKARGDVIPGEIAYSTWKAEREYNKVRTRALKTGEEVRVSRARDMRKIGPTRKQLLHQGVPEEDVDVILQQKTIEEIREYEARYLRLTQNPRSFEQARAAAHRNAITTVVTDLPISEEMKSALLEHVDAMSDREIIEFYGSGYMARFINKIYEAYRLAESGIALQQVADLRSANGGYLSAVQYLVDALGLSERYADVAKELTREEQRRIARGVRL